MNQEDLAKLVSERVKTILGDNLVTIVGLQAQIDEANRVIGELRVELATIKNGEFNQVRQDHENKSQVQ